MPDIFKQAMENNSRNEKCVTGGALMFGGKYSEYALAVNMKKDADLEPEDQELCESRTIVTNIVCKEFDKWLAGVCIKKNKTKFYSGEYSDHIPEINHILVIRRKNTENTEEDSDASDEYKQEDCHSDYNYTFV